MNNLQKYFPEIEELYDYQSDALALLKNYNTLAIVPTGGGKSLVFQLAAMNYEGITLVISPLIALMSEQVKELNERGIPTIALNSSMSLKKQREYLRNFKKSNDKIIYLSPERLSNSFFKKVILASKKQIDLIAIDEAHCISQWGDDFRPEYSRIKKFLYTLQKNGFYPKVIALTATLSQKPRKDIKREFSIKKTIIHDKIIRDDLILNFKKVEEEKEKIPLLIDFINKREIEAKKVIVYLYSRQKCEELSSEMNEKGIKSEYFHAGLESNKKQVIYDHFKKSNIRVLFATSAFGMGINIPDIDAIVHMHIPNSIEEYYQQVGRGARKISKCHCLFLWSDTNFKRRETWIKKANIDNATLQKVYKNFYFENQKGKIKSVSSDNLQDNRDLNLSQIRFQFEKEKLVEFLGHANGSPLTIRFYNTKKFWQEYISNIDETLDNFEIASMMSGIPIENIIDFLYEEDIENNIEHLPAMKKYLFFKVFYNSIPKETEVKIITEINNTIDVKLERLYELKELVECENPKEFIRTKLTQKIA